MILFSISLSREWPPPPPPSTQQNSNSTHIIAVPILLAVAAEAHAELDGPLRGRRQRQFKRERIEEGIRATGDGSSAKIRECALDVLLRLPLVVRDADDHLLVEM